MPKRTYIESIMLIGSGPIVIGQACEFDYSGTQACKALKDEGYRDIAKDELEKLALKDEIIQRFVSEGSVRKVIVVPEKLVNIVIG